MIRGVGAEAQQTARKVARKECTFTALDYLTKYALPNFHFHVTTAYDILRHNGAPLGNADYVAPID